MGGNPPALAAAEATTQEEPWQEADGLASGPDGNPVRAGERHPLRDVAPGVGMRQRDELPALSADRQDVTELVPLVDAFPAVGGKRGRPQKRPDALLGDAGYDSRRSGASNSELPYPCGH